MKHKVALIGFAVGFAAVFAVAGCESRTRSADLDVTLEDVRNDLAEYQLIAQQKTAPYTAEYTAAMTSFIGLHESSGSTIYYGEGSPAGKMGVADIVVPMDFSLLSLSSNNAINTAATDRRYAYFVVSDGPQGLRGALILTGLEQGFPPANVTQSNPQASPSSGDTQVSARSTPQVNFIFVANNDGAQFNGTPGQIADDGYFEMELNMLNKKRLLIETNDLADGDLAEVIQLRVYEIDSAGSKTHLGFINLAQPL
ncbi:MAG: hypothetical protein IT289_10215 [Oligoflexia bacterium]|nr:hypothetical protein [Oligoflexia bacterium]